MRAVDDGNETLIGRTAHGGGWLMTGAGLRGVVNDAVAVYFQDVALAAAFTARWCRQRPPDVVEGAFVMRDDDPVPRRLAPLHSTL